MELFPESPVGVIPRENEWPESLNASQMPDNDGMQWRSFVPASSVVAVTGDGIASVQVDIIHATYQVARTAAYDWIRHKEPWSYQQPVPCAHHRQQSP